MSNSPTPSQPTNQLIQMATAIAEGEASPETYQQILQQRLEDSAINREMFEERAHQRGEAFLDANGHLVDDVLDHMEAYERGLMRHAEFFESGEAKALIEGNDMLAEAIVPLLQALEIYGRAFLAFGPSEHPLMNSVLNTLRGIIEKTTPVEVLNELKRTSLEYHQKAIEEIDASEDGKSEGYQMKRKAFEDLNRAVTELEPVETIEDIEDAVRHLQLALEARVTADEKIFSENVALAPTEMPSANVLINACRGALSEMVEPETLVEALQWYRSFTEELEDQFDLAMEGETNSLVILEELPKTREIMDLHDEVLDRLEEALEEMEPEVVEGVIEELIDVVERLHASSEIFLEAAQREGKLICVKCGHANPPTNRSCESCGFNLPQLVDPSMYGQSTFEMEERSGLEEETDDDYHMGVNTFALFEACYNYYEGHIEEEEFRGHIERSRATVHKSEDGLHVLSSRELTDKQEEMMTPEQLQTFRDSQEMFMETKHLLEEGIDEWLDGLEHFETFIETRHRPTLETGIQLVFVASQKIHKVTKLGEIAQKTLEQVEDQERQEVAGGGAQAAAEEEPTEESSPGINTEESYG